MRPQNPGDACRRRKKVLTRRHLVGIEWGPRGANDKDRTYMSRANGKEIIRHLVEARAEYAVVFMKDMKFAYYNSRVARKAPGLGKRMMYSTPRFRVRLRPKEVRTFFIE